MTRHAFPAVLAFTFASASLALACSKKESEPAPAIADAGVAQTSASLDAASAKLVETDGGDPVVGALPTGTGMGVKTRSDKGFALLGALDKLAVEKNDRPKNALKAETVFDAIESKLKMPVTRRRQVLGFTVKAGYCELGDVEPNLNICVCEYDDKPSLESGREPRVMLKVPNREIVEVHLATVAVQRAEPTPEANAKAKQIVDFVKKLPAP